MDVVGDDARGANLVPAHSKPRRSRTDCVIQLRPAGDRPAKSRPGRSTGADTRRELLAAWLGEHAGRAASTRVRPGADRL